MLTWTFETNAGGASWVSGKRDGKNCFSILMENDRFLVALWDEDEFGYGYAVSGISSLEDAKIIAELISEHVPRDTWPIVKMDKKETDIAE